MRATRAGSVTVVLSLVLIGCGLAADEAESLGGVSQAAEVCGVGPTVPGIDVSYYQGKPDWNEVAMSGKRFAITRINHGGFMDPEFDRNWKEIREVGMVRGSYQFFASMKDPIAMADLVLEKVGQLGPGDLAPVIDVELTDGAEPAEMAAEVGQWIDHVEQAIGRKPIIYTGRYFWNDNVATTAFKDYPLWIAHYTSNSCPNLPAAWNAWAVWQYSSTGSVPGITGNVDMNRLNGDELALQDLAANGYRASVVSLDYVATMAAGSTATVELVLKNEGARSWGEQTELGTSSERDRHSAFAAPSWISDQRVLSIDGSVKSGQQATLKFNLVAPSEPGTYLEHFNLVQEGVAWFSDIVPGGGPDDRAIALSITVTAVEESVGVGTGAGGSGGSAAEANGLPHSQLHASCAIATNARRNELANMSWLPLAALWLRVWRRSSRIGAPWLPRPSTRSSTCSPATRRRKGSRRRSC